MVANTNNLNRATDLLRNLGIDSPDAFQGFAGAVLGGWVSLALRRGVARTKPDRIGRADLATRARARRASNAAEGR